MKNLQSTAAERLLWQDAAASNPDFVLKTESILKLIQDIESLQNRVENLEDQKKKDQGHSLRLANCLNLFSIEDVVGYPIDFLVDKSIECITQLRNQIKTQGGIMGSAEAVQVNLLVCNCKDCTHWKINKTQLFCVTCGLVIPIIATVKEHDKLHWDDKYDDLVCNCNMNSHWEIIKEADGSFTGLCKECNFQTPVTINNFFIPQDKLNWQPHAR